MEETIEHVVRSITPARERKAWKNLAQYLPPPLNTAQLQHSWKTIYSRAEMEASLAKVTLVGFSEKKDVFGLLTGKYNSQKDYFLLVLAFIICLYSSPI